jgi:hypothetical protein
MTTFADPADPGGDKLPLAELNGAVLIFDVLEALDNVQTTFGMTNPVRANVHVVDGPNKGTSYNDTLIFPKVLAGSLRPNVGRQVVARLGQGIAKAGQSAPWTLNAVTDADKNAAAELWGKLTAPVSVDGF